MVCAGLLARHSCLGGGRGVQRGPRPQGMILARPSPPQAGNPARQGWWHAETCWWRANTCDCHHPTQVDGHVRKTLQEVCILLPAYVTWTLS